MEIADLRSAGRVISVPEGGYALERLAPSGASTSRRWCNREFGFARRAQGQSWSGKAALFSPYPTMRFPSRMRFSERTGVAGALVEGSVELPGNAGLGAARSIVRPFFARDANGQW